MDKKSPDELKKDNRQSQEQLDSESQRIFNKENSSNEQNTDSNSDDKHCSAK